MRTMNIFGTKTQRNYSLLLIFLTLIIILVDKNKYFQQLVENFKIYNFVISYLIIINLVSRISKKTSLQERKLAQIKIKKFN